MAQKGRSKAGPGKAGATRAARSKKPVRPDVTTEGLLVKRRLRVHAIPLADDDGKRKYTFTIDNLTKGIARTNEALKFAAVELVFDPEHDWRPRNDTKLSVCRLRHRRLLPPRLRARHRSDGALVRVPADEGREVTSSGDTARSRSCVGRQARDHFLAPRTSRAMISTSASERRDRSSSVPRANGWTATPPAAPSSGLPGGRESPDQPGGPPGGGRAAGRGRHRLPGPPGPADPGRVTVSESGPTTPSVAGEPVEEAVLRPRRLREFVGQATLRQHLDILLEASRRRGEAMDHLLLAGPPGLGKTSLAAIVAAEMGVACRITSGPALERAGDLASVLTNLEEGDVLFIDEIHRLPRVVEEILYPAMEDFQLDIVLGKGPRPAPCASTCPASAWWGPPPGPG